MTHIREKTGENEERFELFMAIVPNLLFSHAGWERGETTVCSRSRETKTFVLLCTAAGRSSTNKSLQAHLLRHAAPSASRGLSAETIRAALTVAALFRLADCPIRAKAIIFVTSHRLLMALGLKLPVSEECGSFGPLWPNPHFPSLLDSCYPNWIDPAVYRSHAKHGNEWFFVCSQVPP